MPHTAALHRPQQDVRHPCASGPARAVPVALSCHLLVITIGVAALPACHKQGAGQGCEHAAAETTVTARRCQCDACCSTQRTPRHAGRQCLSAHVKVGTGMPFLGRQPVCMVPSHGAASACAWQARVEAPHTSGRQETQDAQFRANYYLLAVLPLHAARAAAAEGAGQREVNVLLAVHAHQEAGDIDQLLADAASTNNSAQCGSAWGVSPCTLHGHTLHFCIVARAACMGVDAGMEDACKQPRSSSMAVRS